MMSCAVKERRSRVRKGEAVEFVQLFKESFVPRYSQVQPYFWDFAFRLPLMQKMEDDIQRVSRMLGSQRPHDPESLCR